jgi:hypothetical protein
MEVCSDHERWWINAATGEGRCVDKNLADAWLATLNRLSVFRLTSICEGHPDANNLNQKDHPCLRLQVKPARVSDFRRWEHQGVVSGQSIQDRIQHPGTLVECGWSEIDPTVFYLYVDCQHHRTSQVLEQWVTDWFQHVIATIRDLDSELGSRRA